MYLIAGVAVLMVVVYAYVSLLHASETYRYAVDRGKAKRQRDYSLIAYTTLRRRAHTVRSMAALGNVVVWGLIFLIAVA